MRIAKKWVSPPYNVDGWRLDVAADLGFSQEYNHYFWQQFRKSVKEANPNAIIIAEHYGDPTPWLQGNEWDTVMNYDAFMEPVTWFLTGMEKHSDEYRWDLDGNGVSFREAMRYHLCSFTGPSIQCAMNELSNHDHSRFLTRTNRKVGRVGHLGSQAASENVDKSIMRLAVLIQMTFPGAPTIYYGDEVGVCGFTDPDNRRTYPWGKEDFELVEFHRDMIAIHKRNQVLKTGSTKLLVAEKELMAFARFDENDQVLTVINMSDMEQNISLPVWTANMPMSCTVERLMKVTTKRYNVGHIQYQVKDGMLELRMDPMSCKVLKRI